MNHHDSVDHSKIFWLIAAYASALAFLSLNPWLLPDPHQAVGFITWDLLDHAAAYGLLAILLLTAFKRPVWKLPATLLVALLSSLAGLMLEFGQLWFTEVRHFSLSDATANVVGSCLGVGAFCFFRLALPKPRFNGN